MIQLSIILVHILLKGINNHKLEDMMIGTTKHHYCSCGKDMPRIIRIKRGL